MKIGEFSGNRHFAETKYFALALAIPSTIVVYAKLKIPTTKKDSKAEETD